MRATQVKPTQIMQMGRYSILHCHSFVPNWVACTEFTLRPRFARTGVAGHDKKGARGRECGPGEFFRITGHKGSSRFFKLRSTNLMGLLVLPITILSAWRVTRSLHITVNSSGDIDAMLSIVERSLAAMNNALGPIGSAMCPSFLASPFVIITGLSEVKRSYRDLPSAIFAQNIRSIPVPTRGKSIVF